ncbi:class I tRNA ligase family protein, partial [Coxiella burnetii]
MTTEKRQILVTAALPYANGPIHLGHMVEHIQADIWVRFQRLKGNDCLFICGEDAHGTAIMITAQKQWLPPEELVAQMHTE